jgi:NifU-like protein involved in Fe-S cluster formation
VGVAGVPGEGRYVVLQLAVDRGCISAARFQSHGCGATIASASMLTELLVGRTLHECRELTVEDLLAALGGLPGDKRHCAGFALSALREALADDPGEILDNPTPPP